MKRPYTTSIVVAVAFWLVASLALEFVRRSLHVERGEPLSDLFNLLSWLSALMGWEWMRPIREPKP